MPRAPRSASVLDSPRRDYSTDTSQTMFCKPLIPAAGLIALLAASPGQPPTAPPGSLVGITVPSKMALVSPEQAGKIVNLAVGVGDRVKTGDVLFQLNSKLEDLEVQRLEALATSNVFERRAQMTLKFAEQQAARTSTLHNQDISSERDMQKQAHELAMARLAVEQAQLDKKQANNQLLQAKERLSQRTVLSPFEGMITTQFRGTGEAVEKFVPVVEVMSLDPLWIEFECPIQHQDKFREGSKVLVAPARRPEDERIATIEFISSKATASSHSFTIRATVPNHDYKWQTGLKMNVEANPGSFTPSKPSGK